MTNARSGGGAVFFAPNLNLYRDPRRAQHLAPNLNLHTHTPALLPFGCFAPFTCVPLSALPLPGGAEGWKPQERILLSPGSTERGLSRQRRLKALRVSGEW